MNSSLRFDPSPANARACFKPQRVSLFIESAEHLVKVLAELAELLDDLGIGEPVIEHVVYALADFLGQAAAKSG